MAYSVAPVDRHQGDRLLPRPARAAAKIGERERISDAQRAFESSNDVLGLIAKAKTERKDGQPLVTEPILQLAPYDATLEYRAAIGIPVVHETEAELMYVIDGSGTIVTGGKLTDPKRIIAANVSGANIEGGTSQAINKGDFLIVPQNTPHQITPSGGTIILMTVKMPRTAAPH